LRNRLSRYSLVLAVYFLVVLLVSNIGTAYGKFTDSETASGNTFTGKTSSLWTQTSQADFNTGVLTNIDTASSPGDVKLSLRSDWYNSQWNRRKAITFTSDAAKIPSSQNNFPVLISLASDSELAAYAQTSGNDILFTSSDGVTKLNHEIEYYNNSTGQLVAWVNVSSLSTNTVIYLYYGNSGCSSQQNPTGVWDGNYKGVWHLKENSTGKTYIETLRPNAAGDETGISWQSPGTGAHWDKVDEASADDLTTYIYTTNSSSYQRDLYNVADHTVSGTVNSVTAYFRVASSSFSYQVKAKPSIKTHNIVYDGNEQTVSSSWESDSQTWANNPNTGTAWTWSEIDALQAGVSLEGSFFSTAARCTQVYVDVDYSLYNDSTQNGNGGKDEVTSTDKTGQIGSGQGFNGTDDWIDLGDNSTLQIATVLTVEAWCKPAVISAYMGIGGKLQDANDAGYSISKVDTNKFRFQTATGGFSTLIDSNSAYADTSWHYVVGVRRAGVNYLYVDGIQQTQTSATLISESGLDAHIGRQYVDYDGRWWNGDIDEFRISNVGRSADWILICYKNQSSPATFYTLGSVQGIRNSTGSLASQVLDTGTAGGKWNAIFWDTTLPSNTTITIEVRASDTAFAKGDITPSWTGIGGTSPVLNGLPSGRYKQWRVSLNSSDPINYPVLSEIRTYYY
jgi:hypothetical protein